MFLFRRLDPCPRNSSCAPESCLSCLLHYEICYCYRDRIKSVGHVLLWELKTIVLTSSCPLAILELQTSKVDTGFIQCNFAESFVIWVRLKDNHSEVTLWQNRSCKTLLGLTARDTERPWPASPRSLTSVIYWLLCRRLACCLLYLCYAFNIIFLENTFFRLIARGMTNGYSYFLALQKVHRNGV